jgi:hypothetical protein
LNVYWAIQLQRVDWSLLRASATGSDPVTVASGLTAPFASALDSTFVYWTEAGSVMKSPM